MGKSKNQAGYIEVDAPDHPRAYRGKVLEHILVMEEYLDIYLPTGSIVHHRNRIRSDNRIENLLLLRCDGDHWALHRAIDRQDAQLVIAFEESSRVYMDELSSRPQEVDPINDYQDLASWDEGSVDQFEGIFARRNRITNKIFIEFDDEMLISPEGKEIELDERFGEREEVPESELTEKQLLIYNAKMNASESAVIEAQKRFELRRRLYKELRIERSKIARERGIVLYHIFDNKTLMEMADVMPTTPAMMLQVYGVGLAKLDMYGNRFLEAIRKFKEDFKVAS